jgi:hypothetical protein
MRSVPGWVVTRRVDKTISIDPDCAHEPADLQQMPSTDWTISMSVTVISGHCSYCDQGVLDFRLNRAAMFRFSAIRLLRLGHGFVLRVQRQANVVSVIAPIVLTRHLTNVICAAMPVRVRRRTHRREIRARATQCHSRHLVCCIHPSFVGMPSHLFPVGNLHCPNCSIDRPSIGPAAGHGPISISLTSMFVTCQMTRGRHSVADGEVSNNSRRIQSIRSSVFTGSTTACKRSAASSTVLTRQSVNMSFLPLSKESAKSRGFFPVARLALG